MYKGPLRNERRITTPSLDSRRLLRLLVDTKKTDNASRSPDKNISERMLLRHRYQSPETLASSPSKKELQHSPEPSPHYRSARLLDCKSLDYRQTHTRKRVEKYSYSTADLLGEGFTSRVYKATRDGISEPFAIKVVELKKYSASNREMLESEITILKSIDHPNIIRCYDVYLTVNNCYIVTEYCEGGDLYTLMKRFRGDQLSDSRVAAIMKDILSGFRYLSEQGVVHRDIKPANIFFRQGIAKLADFGFAKKLSLLKEKENFNVGTPLYMPLQALTDSKYSLKSDVFSIGVLFYELLFGRSPWECRSEKELVKKLVEEPIQFPKQLSAGVTALIQGCLAIDEQLRFSVDQLFGCQFVQTLMNNPESVEPLRPYLIQPIPKQPIQPPTDTRRSPIKASSPTPRTMPAGDRKMQMDRNASILLVQLNLCRFMYYLNRNRIPLMEKKSKDRLNAVLQRHILRLMIKLTELGTKNNFKLTEYRDFKIGSQFLKMYSTICEYQTRYRSEFVGNNLAEVEGEEILLALRQYDQDNSDREFYEQASNIVRPLAKELLVTLDKKYQSETTSSGSSIVSSLEGLRSLLKYLSLLKMMVRHFEDYEYFMMFSSITVLPDYAKSTASSDQFSKLKQLLG